MKHHPRLRDRRDIGKVEFLMDKMTTARELSSCCVGIEAALERSAVAVPDFEENTAPWPFKLWGMRPG